MGIINDYIKWLSRKPLKDCHLFSQMDSAIKKTNICVTRILFAMSWYALKMRKVHRT